MSSHASSQAGMDGMAQVGRSWSLECCTNQNKCYKVSGVCVCVEGSPFVGCPRTVTDNHREQWSVFLSLFFKTSLLHVAVLVT